MTAAQPQVRDAGVLPGFVGRAAVFDLDRTLLAGSSLVALARAMSRSGLLSGQQLLTGLAMDQVFRRRGASDEEADRLRAAALRQIAGADVASLRALAAGVGHTLSRQVLPGALHRIAKGRRWPVVRFS